MKLQHFDWSKKPEKNPLKTNTSSPVPGRGEKETLKEAPIGLRDCVKMKENIALLRESTLCVMRESTILLFLCA